MQLFDYGKIVALGTPLELKKQVGGDIIIMTSNQKIKLKKELEKWYKKEVKKRNGFLQVEVSDGEKFLPRLFNELTTKIDSIELRKTTLDGAFPSFTGRDIREEEVSDKDHMRQYVRMRRRI